MSAHALACSIDPGWSVRLVLSCEHGIDEMPWVGDYDEFGGRISDEPTGHCWVQEWIDADDGDVHELLDKGADWANPQFPTPVECWFNGDHLVITRVQEDP